jgi:ABC-type lipoprotein release transport system permease subunit
MNLSFFIAKRYLFSKNNRNAINIISFISVTVLTVATAALIIVLSVFNGIDQMISERINTYAPDLKIVPITGKTFKLDEPDIQQVMRHEAIDSYSAVLEENVLLKAGDKQLIAVAKGVDDNYTKTNNLADLLVAGDYNVHQNNRNAVFGIALAINLGINIPAAKSISVWIPNRKNISTANPQASFKNMHLIPAGIAEVEEKFDSKYIVTALNNIQKLTDRKASTISALEIKIKKSYTLNDVQKELSAILGENKQIKNRHEQYDFLYSVMQSEKLATFLILSFIILIAGFSITSSVIMLIIEKKDNMISLLNMGIRYSDIKKIFITQGLLITTLSGIIGLSLGAVFCLLQQEFGFISYSPDGMYMSSPYPVQLRLSDFIYAFSAIILIGTLISVFPVMRIRRFLMQ